MFGRATMYDGDPARIEEAISFVRDRVRPAIDGLPGSYGLGMWCNRDSGQVAVVTAWADEAALEASASTVLPLREEGSRILGAQPQVLTFEPVVLEQARPDEPGYWTRTILMSGDPATTDSGIELFRSDVLPAVQKLAGCTSVMLGVNRKTGDAIVTSTFSSRAAVEAAREAAAAIREASTGPAGVEVLRIIESEVTIVGIRGPELPGQRTIELPTETSV